MKYNEKSGLNCINSLINTDFFINIILKVNITKSNIFEDQFCTECYLYNGLY